LNKGLQILVSLLTIIAGWFLTVVAFSVSWNVSFDQAYLMALGEGGFIAGIVWFVRAVRMKRSKKI
jgi:hypothetical protein